MKSGHLATIAVTIIVLSLGLIFLSGQPAQVSASQTPSSWCSSYYGYSYYYYYNYYAPSKYQLTVTTDPPSIASVTGGGTYDQGTSASFSVSQNIVQVSKTTRYVFSHWSGDYS